MLRFYWYQPIYYKIDDSNFPSDSREGRGRFVGISKNVGHAMTFKVLTDDTKKIINRSNIRPADDPLELNLRLDSLISNDFIKSKHDVIKKEESNQSSESEKHFNMPILNPSDIVGRTFLMEPTEDGQRL